MAGIVPPGASGVTDYGRLLGDALSERGFVVRHGWVTADGHSWRSAVPAATRFLRSALGPPAGSTVLWHYSSFAYGLRGVPLHGVLFGMVARARRCRVVTILHEPAYPRGRRGWRGAVQAATQGLALRPVVLASSALVVTTDLRARDARRLRRPFRRTVHTVPVFSTLGVPETSSDHPSGVGGPTVGVLKYTGDGTRADVLVGALARLPADLRPRLELLGAPGPAVPEVRPWTDAARAAGLSSRLEFSGVLEGSELSRRLRACDVLVIPNDEGPSGRRTTVAAGLAHGVPTVALDGPELWSDLVESGALLVVPADADAVAAALVDLLRSPQRRAALATRGRAFYDRRMTLDRAADAIAGIVAAGVRSPGNSRRGTRSPSPTADG